MYRESLFHKSSLLIKSSCFAYRLIISDVSFFTFRESSHHYCCQLLGMSQKIIILDFLGMSITPGSWSSNLSGHLCFWRCFWGQFAYHIVPKNKQWKLEIVLDYCAIDAHNDIINTNDFKVLQHSKEVITMSEEFERKTISVRELHTITGIAGSTIRKWLKDGDIKGIKAGKRRWLIPVSELQRMLKS